MESTKTGVLYDPLTLLHRCQRYHPERPERVASIIKHLKDKNLLNHPRVQFIEKLKQAPQELISMAHNQKYIDNVNKLLNQNNSRSHVMVLDTYYNKHSKLASHLAVGGVIEGLDNIVSGRWKNAFAIVRPPGHHSGARNTINGFCVYNNVAIGIEYLRRKHKFNRIAVFDWDVHHGDGTQHIFRQDKDLLFISLHKFDRGSFYPGESGSHLNVGQNAAEGMQINIPWDTVNKKYKSYQLKPGDNEYIYIFERALYPILSSFKPEFIFVSAGFDSARGDPLGGMSVGPEGYRYMTRKLLKLAPLIVVLEGGYNLKSISQAAESVLCSLIGEEGPRETSFNDNELKDKCWLPQYYHENIDRILPTFKKYWPLLESNKLLEYENTVKSNPKRVFGSEMGDEEESSSSESEKQVEQSEQIVYSKQLKQKKQQEEQQEKQLIRDVKVANPTLEGTIKEKVPFNTQKGIEKLDAMYPNHKKPPIEIGYYLAAGDINNFRFENQKVYKSVKDDKQIEFYRNDFPERIFAPKLLGFGQKFVVLENLLYDIEQPNVVDINIGKTDFNSKLSQAKMKKQQEENRLSSTGQCRFRIVGLVTPQLKQQGLLFKDEELIRKVLRKVIDKNNKQLILDFLNDLQKTLRNCRRKYYQTSILIIKSAAKTRIRWIDFNYWNESEDYDINLVQGLSNLAKFVADLTDD